MSPKSVNYKHNPATILNHQYCGPNQPFMSIIVPQFQTINIVAQISQLRIQSSDNFKHLVSSHKSVNMSIIEPQFQTYITVAQISQL